MVLKRRKYLTRTSCAVFSGANAVDVLYRHIQSNPDKFPEKEFARPNVARLCQRFLDLRVFFPAKEKSSLKLVFEDSHFVFYRFNPANDYIGKSIKLFLNIQIPSVLSLFKCSRDALKITWMRELHKNRQSLISILCKTSSRTYDQSDTALEDILLVPRNPKYKIRDVRQNMSGCF